MIMLIFSSMILKILKELKKNVYPESSVNSIKLVLLPYVILHVHKKVDMDDYVFLAATAKEEADPENVEVAFNSSRSEECKKAIKEEHDLLYFTVKSRLGW